MFELYMAETCECNSDWTYVCRRSRQNTVYIAHESVALPADGDDEVCFISQCFTQYEDLLRERAFFHQGLGPVSGKEFSLRDDLSGSRDQEGKDSKRLGPQWHPLSAPGQEMQIQI